MAKAKKSAIDKNGQFVERSRANGVNTVVVHFRVLENGLWEKRTERMRKRGLNFSKAQHLVTEKYKGCVLMRCEYV